jgi:hypothetical protein
MWSKYPAGMKPAGSLFMRAVAFIALFTTGLPVLPLDASDFSGLEGWTVAAVTTVEDDFEGCDFDKKIKFDNGWTLTCSSYSYSYAYRPDAVIFTRKTEYRSRQYLLMKVLIDDDFYDMYPVPAR